MFDVDIKEGDLVYNLLSREPGLYVVKSHKTDDTLLRIEHSDYGSYSFNSQGISPCDYGRIAVLYTEKNRKLLEDLLGVPVKDYTSSGSYKRIQGLFEDLLKEKENLNPLFQEIWDKYKSQL